MFTALCVMQLTAPIRLRWVLHVTHPALKLGDSRCLSSLLPEWMKNPQPQTGKLIKSLLMDKNLQTPTGKSQDSGRFCTFPARGFLWGPVLQPFFNCRTECFDDWAPIGREGRHAQKQTKMEEGEEGEEGRGLVRQQIPHVSIPSSQPASTAAAARRYFETCLCVKAAVVRACPAAWAPCEENKV